MKYLLTLMCIVLSFASIAQIDCEQMIKDAEKLEKAKNYGDAIKIYLAAKDCDPSQVFKINQRIEAAYIEVNKLKEIAESQTKKANKRAVELEKEKNNVAIQRDIARKEKKRAENLSKETAIINFAYKEKNPTIAASVAREYKNTSTNVRQLYYDLIADNAHYYKELSPNTYKSEVVFDLLFFENGEYLAVSYVNEHSTTIRIWEVASGEMQSEFEIEEYAIKSMAVNEKDKELYLGGYDLSEEGVFISLDISNVTEKLYKLDNINYPNEVKSILFIPSFFQEGIIALGLEDGTIVFKEHSRKSNDNSRTSEPFYTDNATARVSSMDYIAQGDDKYFLTVSKDFTSAVEWEFDNELKDANAEMGNEKVKHGVEDKEGHAHIGKYIKIGGETKIVTAGCIGNLNIYSWTGEFEKSNIIHDGAIIDLEHNDKYIITAGLDKTVVVWDIDLQKEVLRLKGHESDVTSITINDNGIVATADKDGNVRLWNIAANLVGQKIGGGEISDEHLLSFSPNHRFILKEHQTFDLKDGTFNEDRPTEFSPHLEMSQKADISPYGNWVAAAEGSHILLWHILYQDKLDSLIGHQALIQSIQFSHDNRYIISADMTGQCIIWNVGTKDIVVKFPKQPYSVSKAIFSPDGQYVLMGDMQGRLSMWESGEGYKTVSKTAAVFPQHGDQISDLFITANNKLLGTSSMDGHAKVFNSQGRVIKNIDGHNGAVYTIDIDTINNMVMTGGDEFILITDLYRDIEYALKNKEATNKSTHELMYNEENKIIIGTNIDGEYAIYRYNGADASFQELKPGNLAFYKYVAGDPSVSFDDILNSSPSYYSEYAEYFIAFADTSHSFNDTLKREAYRKAEIILDAIPFESRSVSNIIGYTKIYDFKKQPYQLIDLVDVNNKYLVRRLAHYYQEQGDLKTNPAYYSDALQLLETFDREYLVEEELGLYIELNRRLGKDIIWEDIVNINSERGLLLIAQYWVNEANGAERSREKIEYFTNANKALERLIKSYNVNEMELSVPSPGTTTIEVLHHQLPPTGLRLIIEVNSGLSKSYKIEDYVTIKDEDEMMEYAIPLITRFKELDGEENIALLVNLMENIIELVEMSEKTSSLIDLLFSDKEFAGALSVAAMARMAMKDFDKAEELLARGEEFYKGSKEIKKARAYYILLKKEDPTTAKTILDEIVETEEQKQEVILELLTFEEKDAIKEDLYDEVNAIRDEYLIGYNLDDILKEENRRKYYKDEYEIIVGYYDLLTLLPQNPPHRKIGYQERIIEVLEAWQSVETDRSKRNDLSDSLAIAYGNLSFYYVKNQQIQEAKDAVQQGLGYSSEEVWMKTNLALAYLLNDEYDKAIAIYDDMMFEPYERTSILYKEVFIKDLDDFQQYGIDHENLERAKEYLTKKKKSE